MQSVYEAVGGIEGVTRLAEAWHELVMEDEVVSHAFSHGFHPRHTERLASYWAEALGGPALYTGRFGDETSVVRMHSGNGMHDEMDRRAIACFDQALDRIGITVNKQIIPDDPRPPLRPSGIRLGTPACTTRGMDEAAMMRIGGWIVQALRTPQDETALAKLAGEVRHLARGFPIPALSS